jgi:ATP-dependent helicase HrpB
MSALPVHSILPDLLAVCADGSSAVLVAPPGAGKTTAVAPALLGEGWCTGQVLLLSPRRLAARAAAERMAELAGASRSVRPSAMQRGWTAASPRRPASSC